MASLRSNMLQNEVVFLTGASRGIGREIAATLAQNGAERMCLIARSKTDLESTAAYCHNLNPKCDLLLCPLDVTDTKALEGAVLSCAEKFGKITLAIHNVGLHGLQSAVGGSLEDVDKNIQVNLTSVIHANRLILPHLVQAQKTQQTRIIFLSSALAQKWAMVPGWTAYTAAKCGIIGYADSCFVELRQCGMKVTVICPGLVATDMGTGFVDDFGKILDRRMKPTDYLQSQDIADAVLLASSPFAGCITEMTLYPQQDLYRMRMLTEPRKIQAIIDAPFPNFVDHKVAFITGAGKGIGRGIARQFAAEGYNLALVARTQADLDIVTAECNSIFQEKGFNQNGVISFAIDVSDKEALTNSVNATLQQFRTVSAVISNAGTNRRKSAALADINIWESVLKTNFVSAMHLTSLTLPHLLRHANNSLSVSAYLVYINSSYAISRAPTLPGAAIYAASKSAMAGFARTVLEDVRAWGVKVSSIYPGLVNTELGTRPNPQQKQGKGAGPDGSLLLPASDMIQVEDIAKLVSYCCSTSATCVATDIMIDNQKSQQPIVRDNTTQFMKQHWPSELLGDAKL